MRWARIVVFGSVAAVLAGLAAGLALAQDRGLERLSEPATDEWTTWNPGEAPVSLALALAALEQGFSKGELMEISESEAPEGAQTSASAASPGLQETAPATPVAGDLGLEGATSHPMAGRGAAYADEGSYYAQHPSAASAKSQEWIDRLPPAWQRYFGPDAVPAGTPSADALEALVSILPDMGISGVANGFSAV